MNGADNKGEGKKEDGGKEERRNGRFANNLN
jgi:hypothetical protein